MAGTATVTAPIGPGLTATALVFTNIRLIQIDPIAASCIITLDTGAIRAFDLKATTTCTGTASSGTFTFTISQ